MKMTILGSGTSHGVPVIGCDCAVCKSTDPKDKRFRASAIVTMDDGRNFLIDVGPDFRQQALLFGLKKLEAVFLTHTHADHLHGIDDLRIFSHKNSGAMKNNEVLNKRFPETQGKGLPFYMNEFSRKVIRKNFHYIFTDHKVGGGTPKLDLISCDKNSAKKPLVFKGLSVVPVSMLHGNLNATGWVFTSHEGSVKKSIVYLTDCNYLSDDSIKMVQDAVAGGQVSHLVIDALRIERHSTHNSFDQALCYADRICAEHTWFTHLSHDLSHPDIQKYIDEHLSGYKNLEKIVLNGGSVSPSYDGLVLE
jgi:phosphoribosyl 1,2-cyclic phosphate phosphodiesterase